MPKRLIFVRHGHTQNNSKDDKTNRMMGWVDDSTGLSKEGVIDAKTTARKLSQYQINAIYHSDLKRTTETAKIICEHLSTKSIPTTSLRERNLGNFAGLTAHEIRSTRPEDWVKFLDHADPDWNGLDGESLRDVHLRFTSFLAELENKHKEGTVLLITHSGILHTILRDIFHFFPKESFIEVNHDSLTILDRVGDDYQLTLHNS